MLTGLQAYSLDLRQKILRACDQPIGSQRAIAAWFGVSQSFIEKLRRQDRRATGRAPRGPGSSVGVSPAASSRGARRQQRSSTKAGHRQARRVRIEAAWASRDPAKVSRHLQLRLEQLSTPVQDIRWKAQVRLCQRYRQLIARGKHTNQVVVAIARELVAFMWAMAKQVTVAP